MGEDSYEALLKEVLDRIEQDNNLAKPGTPMAELKNAVEAAIQALPPLEFEEFSQAVNDEEAVKRLIQRAPEIIGWNADQIVEWIEELSKKL